MRKMFKTAIFASVALAIAWIAPVALHAQGDPVFGYNLELEVVYGQGRVGPDGKEQMRDLKMDIYSPTEAGSGPLPAVVYVHGGAWHRGGLRNPPYKLAGAVHSSPEDWARLLAASGYKVFVIEYRLAPQDPITKFVPGEDNTITDIGSVVREDLMEGFARARAGLGLPMLEYNAEALDLVWNAYMSGVEDASLALDYVVAHAAELNIDPERMAMGGHSAGGGIAASVGLGLRSPLKAIFPLSAPDILFDKDYISGRADLPAVLLHYSQYDDPPLMVIAPGIVEMLRKADTEFTLGWMPGYMHFYPHNAVSLADDGTRMSLGDRVVAFLDKYLKN